MKRLTLQLIYYTNSKELLVQRSSTVFAVDIFGFPFFHLPCCIGQLLPCWGRVYFLQPFLQHFTQTVSLSRLQLRSPILASTSAGRLSQIPISCQWQASGMSSLKVFANERPSVCCDALSSNEAKLDRILVIFSTSLS